MADRWSKDANQNPQALRFLASSRRISCGHGIVQRYCARARAECAIPRRFRPRRHERCPRARSLDSVRPHVRGRQARLLTVARGVCAESQDPHRANRRRNYLRPGISRQVFKQQTARCRDSLLPSLGARLRASRASSRRGARGCIGHRIRPQSRFRKMEGSVLVCRSSREDGMRRKPYHACLNAPCRGRRRRVGGPEMPAAARTDPELVGAPRVARGRIPHLHLLAAPLAGDLEFESGHHAILALSTGVEC